MSKNDFPLPITLDSQIVFKESIIHIQRDILQYEQHPPYPYYTLEAKPYAVVILASTPEGHYVLNREYRHPTRAILLGCPGGFIDEGETPLKAAQRELLEETGFQAKAFQVIGEAYPYAGISNQKSFFVRAQEAVYTYSPQREPSELMQTCLVSHEELTQLIKERTPLDGTLGTALYLASLYNL